MLVDRFSQRMAASSLKGIVDEIKRSAMEILIEAKYQFSKDNSRYSRSRGCVERMPSCLSNRLAANKLSGDR
jgi:hypothetical protein